MSQKNKKDTDTLPDKKKSASVKKEFELLTYDGVKKNIDWDQLKKLCEFKADRKTCAYMLGTSESTLGRRIKERYGITFEEYRDKTMSKTRVHLVNKALKMALEKDNVTLLIFCLKNYCGFSDDELANNRNAINLIQLNYKLD